MQHGKKKKKRRENPEKKKWRIYIQLQFYKVRRSGLIYMFAFIICSWDGGVTGRYKFFLPYMYPCVFLC